MSVGSVSTRGTGRLDIARNRMPTQPSIRSRDGMGLGVGVAPDGYL
jgi:hypothetical protein